MSLCDMEDNVKDLPVMGQEDWRYAFSAARVRTLDSMLLSRALLVDMANASEFESALECLSGTEYAVQEANPKLADVEVKLLQMRSEARKVFGDLMIDPLLKNLVSARADFANMRLAVRRVVTDKPIGQDYSDEGSVPAEIFEEVFEQENYSEFPDYMQEAVEAAVLGYYENKDIRKIDFAISSVAADTLIHRAEKLNCDYLSSLTKIKIDLDNIRTMLRLKFLESQERGPFMKNGYLPIDIFLHGVDLGYDGLSALFYHTAYHYVVDAGVAYLAKMGSFLRLESLCDSYMWQWYKAAMREITAGPQPVIAYLMMKEQEIRTLRMILTAKRNHLDPSLILDRLGESYE